jgi:hypothetical protein
MTSKDFRGLPQREEYMFVHIRVTVRPDLGFQFIIEPNDFVSETYYISLYYEF